MQEQYKSRPFPSLSHPLLSPRFPWEQGELKPFPVFLSCLLLFLLWDFSAHTCLFFPCCVFSPHATVEGWCGFERGWAEVSAGLVLCGFSRSSWSSFGLREMVFLIVLG